MNANRIAFVFGLLLAGHLAAQEMGGASFQMPAQFSAVQNMKTHGMTMATKICMDGDRMRAEMAAQGEQMVFIRRKDEKKIYQLLPAKKICMVMAYEEPSGQQQPEKTLYEKDAKWEKLGAETVESVSCDKYRVTAKDASLLLWVRQDNKLPMRMATEDGKVQVDWTEFKPGPQPEEMFAVPAGYQKLDMGNMGALKNLMRADKMPAGGKGD
ncbi:MAG: DUF4412 domain-containing protein [Verrucomicrobiae bacterium]|nr:DUF4412 domain-containing protein [Verrucomicrobiae bacterium]